MADKFYLIGENCEVGYGNHTELVSTGSQMFYIGFDNVELVWRLMSSTQPGFSQNDNYNCPWTEIATNSGNSNRFQDQSGLSVYSNSVRPLNAKGLGDNIYVVGRGYYSILGVTSLVYGRYNITSNTWVEIKNSDSNGTIYWNGTSTDSTSMTAGTPSYPSLSHTPISTNQTVITYIRQFSTGTSGGLETPELVWYSSGTFNGPYSVDGTGRYADIGNVWDGTSTYIHNFWVVTDTTPAGSYTYTYLSGTTTGTTSGTYYYKYLQHKHYDYNANTFGTVNTIATYGRNTQNPYKGNVPLDNVFTNPVTISNTSYIGVLGAGTNGTGTGSSGFRTHSVIEFVGSNANPTFTVHNINNKPTTYDIIANLTTNADGTLCLLEYILERTSTTTYSLYEGGGYDRLPYQGMPISVVYHTKGTSTVWSTSMDLAVLATHSNYTYVDSFPATLNIWPGENTDFEGTYFPTTRGQNVSVNGMLVYPSSYTDSKLGCLINVGWGTNFQSSYTAAVYALGSLATNTSISVTPHYAY